MAIDECVCKMFYTEESVGAHGSKTLHKNLENNSTKSSCYSLHIGIGIY